MANKAKFRIQKWLNSAWKWFRGFKRNPKKTNTTSEEFVSFVSPREDLPDIEDLQKDVDMYFRTRHWKQ